MNRLFGQDRQDEDRQWDHIRPASLSEYIGQERVKETLKVFIQAARERGEALDHVLLYGPPGLGKTTLAYIISRELEVRLETTSGPALERAGDIAAILTNLSERGVLFIDEIHRLNRVIEEKLYPAMEDFHIDLVVGQGPSARIIPLRLNPYTMVGATTRLGAITSPLRSRFGVVCRLDFYGPEELTSIILRSSKILGIVIREQGALELARRSRGTPRVANRLLRRVRDFAQVAGEKEITPRMVDYALGIMEIDSRGLDMMDHKLMKVIIKNYRGGPVGLDTLAAALSESKDTIEDVLEPYLIQIGMLEKTPRGRCATNNAYRHLGYPIPGDRQGELSL